MKLPNAHLAVVEREKITGYLLNTEHLYGASKARFFSQFGFRSTDWETMVQALREHGQHYEVSRTRETFFGPRFEVDGELNTPDGRAPRVRTVWQLDHGEVAPRLITAYPYRG
ncbi:MAG: hypothetical protein AUG51_14880 [Acidobacteria bacterium 13_1_20CM_3_53_8]|nr:MAG: hypothetical protein AUG51_14880 [Acidobacteria bacterium 13_1_20CM_3_53_8]